MPLFVTQNSCFSTFKHQVWFGLTYEYYGCLSGNILTYLGPQNLARSSRRQLPSLTFLLTQQSTISSIAGWVLGFVSTARDIVSIFKDCREMSQDANSKSESKKSSNEPDGRRPLTDCQLLGVFVFFVLSLISATYIGSWLGEFTVQVNIID